jgi:hypothetical protein
MNLFIDFLMISTVWVAKTDWNAGVRFFDKMH